MSNSGLVEKWQARRENPTQDQEPPHFGISEEKTIAWYGNSLNTKVTPTGTKTLETARLPHNADPIQEGCHE